MYLAFEELLLLVLLLLTGCWGSPAGIRKVDPSGERRGGGPNIDTTNSTSIIICCRTPLPPKKVPLTLGKNMG